MDFLAAVGIPFLLLFVGGFVKKLARGTKGFARKDWFLGAELTLAAFTSGLTQVLDGLRKVPMDGVTPLPPELGRSLLRAGVFTGIVFVVLFLVLSFHQDYERDDADAWRQNLILLGGCNAAGIGAMACFLLLVK